MASGEIHIDTERLFEMCGKLAAFREERYETYREMIRGMPKFPVSGGWYRETKALLTDLAGTGHMLYLLASDLETAVKKAWVSYIQADGESL